MATISESFSIKGTDEVRVRLDVGNGQIAGFSAVMESKQLTPSSQNESHAEYLLGPGDKVRFCDFIATVLVKDVNQQSNATVVTATVSQGMKRMTLEQDEEAPEGGTVSYAVAIFFE